MAGRLSRYAPHARQHSRPLVTQTVFQAVNDSETRSLQTQQINLLPIIDHLQQLDDNSTLSISDLTIKFLLSPWGLRVHVAIRH